MGSKFGETRPGTVELAALECLEKIPIPLHTLIWGPETTQFCTVESRKFKVLEITNQSIKSRHKYI